MNGFIGVSDLQYEKQEKEKHDLSRALQDQIEEKKRRKEEEIRKKREEEAYYE
jgi:hypothetical protein